MGGSFSFKESRSKTVAETFFSQIISRHGDPLEVHTDQGRNFESKIFRELSNMLGIKKTRTTTLHPQSDGQIECQHRTILDYLAKFVSENQKDWGWWIPLFLLAYRTSKHEATGLTPTELYLTQDLRLPIDLLRGNPPKVPEENSFVGYLGKVKKKLEDLHEGVRKKVDIKSSLTKTWYDQKARQIHFEEGQQVWFYNPRRTKRKAPKLQCNWEGPYHVVKKLGDVYCIRKSNQRKNKIVHTDRLAPYLERHLM
ncbi:PREDICTED: uncharacterized protein LOC108776069 [Cyphomyrmex costatus]|uniref:uncharacterized protein LOC108776069 n=1 Tax=Cyphomyrmex costatus TaxID=456900 RepID=UPI0008523C14|nr:PREDICTED: uncharacterized protein LOC108776069 [Cyphomyrmex costatus]